MSASLAGKKIVVIGLGLIGGSLARALRTAEPAARIHAMDRSAPALEQARADGTLDEWSHDPNSACRDADLIVLAIPVLSIEGKLRELAPFLAPHTVITDVASVKGAIVEAAQRVFGRLPRRFIPGHPIAGSEQSGYGAARSDLYRGRKVILTPQSDSDPQAVAAVRALWSLVGAEVLTMDVIHHDQVLAATSHLPHLLAFALVDTLSQQGTREEIFRYAAGGFRDFTRIASSDPVMWRDIFVSNAEATVGILDEYQRELTQLRALLLARDGAALLELFGRANQSREIFLAFNRGQPAKPSE
jgi:prephenate dehydrogenase